MGRTWMLAALAALAVGCSDFRSGAVAAADGGGDSDSDGGAADAGRGVGPGPLGALPTGFCCNADAECRYRHCVDQGGSRMCADECDNSGFCSGGAVSFVCDVPDGSSLGLCVPPQGSSPACVPADQYPTGTRKLGDCCNDQGSGASGWECEGALCVSTDNNPYVCTNWCNSYLDCPGPFACMDVAGRKWCWPSNQTYTCQ